LNPVQRWWTALFSGVYP